MHDHRLRIRRVESVKKRWEVSKKGRTIFNGIAKCLSWGGGWNIAGEGNL